MSHHRGAAAISGIMTDRIPHTELSANQHWELVEKVTGLPAVTATLQERRVASSAFIKAWDYDLFWYAHSCVSTDRTKDTWFPDHGGPDFLQALNPQARRTRMGHAVYQEDAAGTSDFSSGVSCPFESMETALQLDPLNEYGFFDSQELITEFERAHKRLVRYLPDTVVPGGVYITMFSGLIEIYGWEMFLMLMTEPSFDSVIEGYYQWVRQQYEAYAASDVEYIISHDDLVWTSGPVTSLQWYRKHIFPRLEQLWEPLKAAGKKILFTCDGDMTKIAADMIALGADMIITEPMTDFSMIAKERCAFFGTFDTRLLLLGTKDEIQREVKEQLDRYREYPGYFFGTGNHIPQNTPVDNILYYYEAYQANCWR
jgi:hypothetical protein